MLGILGATVNGTNPGLLVAPQNAQTKKETLK